MHDHHFHNLSALSDDTAHVQPDITVHSRPLAEREVPESLRPLGL